MNPSQTLGTSAPASPESGLLALASEVIEKFGLQDLQVLLQSIQCQQRKQGLNMAVLGRFKSGKSSFLNHIIGRPLLPVGVLPVTSVVTSVSFGAQESAHIVLAGGDTRCIGMNDLASYISESGNPQNVKDVQEVRISLPSLDRFRSLTFVDTPGLESVFAHNTDTSLAWTPNVDLALVAVSVDSPLTQQDVALIERLHQFTPHVAVLLTKIDHLQQNGQQEVLQFVTNQLREKFPAAITVFPYSINPGYESLGQHFETQYILPALRSFHEHQAAILDRKLGTLLRAIHDYLRLALKSAEIEDADRSALRVQILESEQALADRKLGFRLLARHAAGRTRPAIERQFEEDVRPWLQVTLEQRLAVMLLQWRGGFAETLREFEQWLRGELGETLKEVLVAETAVVRHPLEQFARQCETSLQSFRDQISETVMRVFGMPLRTTESAIVLEPPQFPDVSVGKIFDRNWELISALIPMWLFRPIVERRFRDKVEHEVYKNLSRLTSQWEEVMNVVISKMEKEAERRLDNLVITVQGLLVNEDSRTKELILSYLAQLPSGNSLLRGCKPEDVGDITAGSKPAPLLKLRAAPGARWRSRPSGRTE